MSNSTVAPNQSADILYLESLQLQVRLDYAVLAVVLYDYALTFSAESQYIWKPKKTIVFYLFIVLRYSFIVYMLFLAFTDFLPLHTSKGCSVISHIFGYITVLVTVSTGGISTLRTYAIWRNNVYVLAVSTVLIIGEVGAEIYFNLSQSFSVATDEMRLFTTCIGLPGSHTNQTNVAFTSMAVAFSTLVLILTAARTAQQTLSCRKLNLRQGLSYFVLRDGVLYYLAIEAFDVANIVVTYLPVPIWTTTIVNDVSDLLGALLVQRLVLNLRQIDDELRSPSFVPSLDLGELNFAHGPTLGNIGAPLRASDEDELDIGVEQEQNGNRESEGVDVEEGGSRAIELDEFAIEEVPRV